MCTKGRDVFSASWWLALTRNSSFTTNNCNGRSPSRLTLQKITQTFQSRLRLAASNSVARVRPRTSKGITDLLSPLFIWLDTNSPSKKSPLSWPFYRKNSSKTARLFSRLRSRSLTELTRQITPPTKNGHAPPPIESWKGSQPVNPYYVWTWWVFPCWVKLSRRLHSWWCPSVNSFKFQFCNHTSPGIQKLWFPLRCWRGTFEMHTLRQSLVDIVYG